MTISNGVQDVGCYAFAGCSGLVNVKLGTGIQSISYGAFENCSSIKSIEIPSNIQTIGEFAFKGCSGLTTLTLNEGLKTIYGEAFYGCPITKLVIPDSVTSIQSKYYSNSNYLGAFEECKKLESVVIGDGLTEISRETFRNCTALKSVIIGDFVATIGESAFNGCAALTDVTIGKGVQVIGVCAFSGCSGLAQITIGSNVQTIEVSAFENCTSLKSIDIPANVQTINESAFYGCSGLTTLTLNEGLKAIKGRAFYGCPITQLVIPNSVTTITTAYWSGSDRGAFEECKKLETVVIGNGLTSISNDTFQNCTALKSVMIGDFVATIGESAFNGCAALTDVTIGKGVQVIGVCAFSGCSGLAQITIGSNVQTIEVSAFENCTSLKSIDIPANVQTINESAFYGCSGLTTLTLNEGLKAIKGRAFYGCPITQLVIPNSVTTITTAYWSGSDRGAFEECKKLETVVIGNGLTSISNDTFQNCTALKSVMIGDFVATIGESAFNGCAALTDVSIGKGVQVISNYAFANCTALAYIHIPDNVQTIGERAFEGCTLLVNFNIGTGVQRIGAYALQNCSSLKSVAIPANVQVIGAGLFTNCSSLEEVIIEKGVLRKVENDVFNGCSSFDRIYYTGTASDWVLIAVSEDNSYPLNASPYYYSSSSPSGKGNYWYYNSNGEIRVWNVSETSFKAEEYSEKFANSTFGSSNTSYSSQFLSQLEGDNLFQAKIIIWEALHTATDSSWESKAISKKDVYKMVIYDLLVGEADAEINPLAGMDVACNTYVYDYAKFLLGKDSLTKEELEQLKNLSPLDYDYVEMIEKYFTGLDVFIEVFEMSANLYDALYVAAQYKALSDMDTNFHLVLTEISNDNSLPWDLRNAASECAECYRTATDALLKNIVVQDFAYSTMEVLWNDFQDVAWKAVLESVFPQVKFADLTIKGVMFLANMGFNLDACNEAYYQLESAVGLENALRNVIKNTLPDYLRYNYKDKSEYYMYAIDMYQTSVLLGFDYSNNLLREHSKSVDVNAEKKQAYEKMMAQISIMKEEKATMYNDFKSVIEQLYIVYYS